MIKIERKWQKPSKPKAKPKSEKAPITVLIRQLQSDYKQDRHGAR